MSRPQRRDWRLVGLVLALVAVLAGGWLLRPRDRAGSAMVSPDEGLRRAFQESVVRLQSGQFELALAQLDRALVQAPGLPEAHVNRGFALMGLARVSEARAAFDKAIELRPDQANAYYGLALSHEAQGDLALARGAMRSYLHLARDERPEHLSRARAALWEWEQAAGGR